MRVGAVDWWSPQLCHCAACPHPRPLQLFTAAAEAAAAYQRWKSSGDSRPLRTQSLKRKRAAEGGGGGNENAAANAGAPDRARP